MTRTNPLPCSGQTEKSESLFLLGGYHVNRYVQSPLSPHGNDEYFFVAQRGWRRNHSRESRWLRPADYTCGMLTQAHVDIAVTRAITYLQGVRHPHALMFMTVLHRRFGIEEFADAGERYDAVLPEYPDKAAVLRVFRRAFDADNPLVPDDWEHVTIPTDRLLITALYCDRLGLPPTFVEALRAAVSQGGYGVTHAILAWTWVQENGCKLELPEGFLEEMFSGAAAMIDEDPTSIDDVKLEAAAFLCMARQSARVNLEFVKRVIAYQNGDGGWGAVNDSNWHATILALMIVLHVSVPGFWR